MLSLALKRASATMASDTSDKAERTELILSGRYKSVDIASRNPEQLARLAWVFSSIEDQIQTSSTLAIKFGGLGENSKDETKTPPTQTKFETMKAQISSLDRAQTLAMRRFFDVIGAPDISWEAHMWLTDYECWSSYLFRQGE